MLLFALAERAATFADAGAETDSGVLEDGYGAKEDAGKERDEKSEEQDRCVNANLADARKSGGSDGGEDAQRGVSQTQTNGAAK